MRKAARWFVPFLALSALVWAQEQAATVTVDIVSAENLDMVLGTATLEERAEGGVRATLEIGPNDVIAGGEHAIHVHENGACTPADSDGDGTEEPAGAAGGHYNPTGVGHGEDNGPHVGDSENYNYTFNDDGSFSGEVVFPLASLTGDNAFLKDGGTAIVIHEGADDMATDPSGESGPRIACGVIMG